MTDATMRERMARSLFDSWRAHPHAEWSDVPLPVREFYFRRVDAILDVLAEPNHVALWKCWNAQSLTYGRPLAPEKEVRAAWQAMITAIREGV
jgi:hypothetical protein